MTLADDKARLARADRRQRLFAVVLFSPLADDERHHRGALGDDRRACADSASYISKTTAAFIRRHRFYILPPKDHFMADWHGSSSSARMAKSQGESVANSHDDAQAI